jgi:hypothetical protein
VGEWSLKEFSMLFTFRREETDYFPVGLHIEDAGGFYTLPQPAGCDAYVHDAARDLTRFSLSEKCGTWGLLAHLHRSEAILRAFAEKKQVTLMMNTGDMIPLEYADCLIFLADHPHSVYTDFIDREGKKWKNAMLFNHIYNSGKFCVFQVCYEENGVKTAGRQFYIFNRKECENALPTEHN